MKKIYVKPQMEVVEIGTEALLASSVDGNVTGAVGSPRKRRNDWDDEFDDDFPE